MFTINKNHLWQPLIIDCSGLFTSTTEVQIITLYYNLSLSNDNFFCVKFMLKTEDVNVLFAISQICLNFTLPFLMGVYHTISKKKDYLEMSASAVVFDVVFRAL